MSLWPASASAERHVSEHRTVSANRRLVSRPSRLVAARRKEPGVSASSRAVTGLCYPVQHRTRSSTKVCKTSPSDDQQGPPPWRIPHLVSELKIKPQAKRRRPVWAGLVWGHHSDQVCAGERSVVLSERTTVRRVAEQCNLKEDIDVRRLCRELGFLQ